MLLAVGILNDADRLSHIVLSFRHDLNNSSADSRRNHDFMLREQIVLEGASQKISSDEHISLFQIRHGVESPFSVLVERRDIDTTGHEYGVRDFSDSLKGSLNSIENGFEDSWSEFDGEGLVCSENGISNGKAS